MRHYTRQKKSKNWLFLLFLISFSVLFFEPITKNINTYIYYETNIIDGKIFNLYHLLPDLEWFYQYQNQLLFFAKFYSLHFLHSLL